MWVTRGFCGALFAHHISTEGKKTGTNVKNAQGRKPLSLVVLFENPPLNGLIMKKNGELKKIMLERNLFVQRRPHSFNIKYHSA
jgi:hypothetical protein